MRLVLPRLLREHIEIGGFFGLLFLLIFVGDGKQEIVDVVATAGVLCLFVVRQMKGKLMATLPWPIQAAWAGVLLYLAVRTAFSDSVGYSISATIRWVMAYSVFVFFSSIDSEKKQTHLFRRAALWLGIATTLAALAATGFKPLGHALPGMNLLYPAYGHNHVANIIIFVFPIVLYQFVLLKSKISVFLILFFSIALVGSFARGAWALLGGYLAYFLLTTRAAPIKLKILGIGAVLAFSATLFALPTLSSYLSPTVSDNPLLRRQVIKGSAIDNRLPYWKQAALAIRERPAFGAGPGTFSLLAKRYQEAPAMHSWFAHSFPLELFAEIGAIGLIGVMWLVGLILRGATHGPIFHGAVLTLIYSLYEINLNFLVVWLLFWATLGMQFRPPLASRKNNFLLTISLPVLALFYIASIAGLIAALVFPLRAYSLFVEPHNKANTLNLLQADRTMSDQELWLVKVFYKKDAQVLAAMADQYKRTSYERAAQTYEEARDLDPQEGLYASSHLLLAIHNERGDDVDRIVRSISEKLLGERYKTRLTTIDFSPRKYWETYTTLLNDKTRFPTEPYELAKIYYRLGLVALAEDPETTRALWLLARDISPTWGYYHVELASLEKNIFLNKQASDRALSACLTYDSPKQQCLEILDTGVYPVGYFKRNIEAIPQVLTPGQ